MEEVARAWFARALPVIRTKDWLETWIDFRIAWANVKKPVGSTMAAIIERSMSGAPPEPIQRLKALCENLQEHHGKRSWPLSCRVAGEAIGVSYKTAAKLLKMLTAEGFIKRVKKAGPKDSRMAAEYRLA